MSEKSVITKEMQNAIGIESYPQAYDVEKGAIRKFAEAIEDQNPIYTDEKKACESGYLGIIAPPTFLRSMEPGTVKSPIRIPYTEMLDGGSEWEYFEPVHVGDQITVTSKIADLKESTGKLGPMLFKTDETKYINQLNQIVARQTNTLIYYQPAKEQQ
tara:strand:+ start:965 stop:1438 length:474 start_codon:yes stop_codon:yes gene_type:complete